MNSHSVSEGRQLRDAVLDTFEDQRAAVLAELRREAVRVWQSTGRPVTVNDVRPALVRLGYEGDPRLLGAVFRPPTWEAVSFTQTDNEKAHGRLIRAFVLRRIPPVGP